MSETNRRTTPWWKSKTKRGGVRRTRNADGVEVCRRGHLMTKENSYDRPGNVRNTQCRECRKITRDTDPYTRRSR